LSDHYKVQTLYNSIILYTKVTYSIKNYRVVKRLDFVAIAQKLALNVHLATKDTIMKH